MKAILFSLNCTFIQHNCNNRRMIVSSRTKIPVLDLKNKQRAPFFETTIIISFASMVKYDNVKPCHNS